jgi:predicted ATPase
VRLSSFRVRVFRNIIDSGEINVDDVTCLVGKNEAGKSALLEALHALHPAKPPMTLDLLDEYPRWLKKEHEISGEIEQAVPITATFVLDETEAGELESTLGAPVLTARQITVTRTYGSDGPSIEAPIDYKAFLTPFLASCSSRLQEATSTANTVDDLRKLLNRLSSVTEGDEAAVALAADARDATVRLDETLGEGSGLRRFVDWWLGERLPKTFYFSTYAQLVGRYDLDEVFAAVAGGDADEAIITAADFLKLARIEPDTAGEWDYEASNAELEAVSSLLTKRVTEHWQQNKHLRLRVAIEPQTEEIAAGQRIRRFLQFRVEDTRHEFSNRLDRRSTGFRWFVSFVAAFLEFEKDENLVLLLDEPGLSLHARAQMDLLGAIEGELAKGRQVLYSTHSPFMVRTAALDHARITEDQGPEKGAITINDAGIVSDPDTLFPLQAALGYDVMQSLFIGNRNVLVEGVSDFIYLTMLSQHLGSLSRTVLLDDCRLLPAGGATNIPTFIALLGTKLDIVVLLDGNSPRQRIESTITQGRLDAANILDLSTFSTVKGADIEDLFTAGEYLSFYNGTYKKSLKVADLTGSDRITKRIARHSGEFNHGEVSAYFLRNLDASLKSLSDGTLARFEDVITAINAALP